MQHWAREINLSETAFVWPLFPSHPPSSSCPSSSPPASFSLRWFTHVLEVDLCGHATLAAAHALWQTGRVELTSPITFHTASGTLLARWGGKEGEEGGGRGGGRGWISLDFPAEPVVPDGEGLGDEEGRGRDLGLVREALHLEDEGAGGGREGGDAGGGALKFVGRSRVDVLVVLTRAAFDRLYTQVPDVGILEKIECRGVIVTCQGEGKDAAEGGGEEGKGGRKLQESGMERAHFLSRFFAPRCGIVEDPVTGSAHCCLAPYWAGELGKRDLVGYQASKRGGMVRVRYDEGASRVCLWGQAVLVKSGWLHV